MQTTKNNESENKIFEGDFNSELPFSVVLSARELQKVHHERKRDHIRKNSKPLRNHRSWDLSGGLLGI